jgi:hypothetical protein
MLLAPAMAGAQARCSRADLQKAVDAYLAAQAKGDPAALPKTTPVKYVENMKDASIASGILTTPLKVDHQRSLLDTEACETFTEAIVTDKAHPYVLGVRLKVASGKVAEFEAMVTDKDDWLFNANSYLKWSSSEDWGVIPANARDTRQTLLAAGNAYEDVFKDNSVKVPWGTPCNRLEGGAHTGKGAPDDSCNVGVPSGMDIHSRRYLVDPEIGALVIFSRFGENDIPDTHLFRIEKGKIRFVHTLTVCIIPNCGFPVRNQPPPQPAAN